MYKTDIPDVNSYSLEKSRFILEAGIVPFRYNDLGTYLT